MPKDMEVLFMKGTELKEFIKGGNLDEKLADIYADPSKTDYQRQRYIKAIEEFNDCFGDGDIEIYSAPGRSEIGGNHTDHQRGQVLAASVNVDVLAIAAPTDDDSIRIRSKGYKMINVSLKDLGKNDSEEGTTQALIKGVVKKLEENGHRIGGFCAFITSDVLSGSGLSSSAAFETAVGTIISGIYNDMKISPVELARVGQYSENVYFGKPCGLMDQMACSVGSLCHIDFFDADEPKIDRVEADMTKFGYSLCITDTKGSHAKLTPHYAAIPAEMKAVAKLLGAEVLSEVPEETFLSMLPQIREKVGDRALLRAIHFYGETKRAAMEADALRNGDFDAFLEVFRESAASSFRFLQNVYPPEDPKAQSTSLALALSERLLGREYGAARIHGGGFAGTIQAFVKNEKVEEYRTMLDKVFGEGACCVLQIRKYGGIRVI